MIYIISRLENIIILFENETERLLTDLERGGGGEEWFLDPDTASGVRTSSLPRAYAEKCIDFDCLHKGGSIHPI